MNKRFDFVGLGLVVLGFALVAAMYASLPDPMPTHWDMQGQVNGSMPKLWGAWLLPAITALIWISLLIVPRISPRGFGMESFGRPWKVVRYAILVFLLLCEVLVLRAAATHAPFPSRILEVSVGALFMAIGNPLGKVTRNFFFGIRTPWTIASEEVWNRTHRLAGKLFVVAGLAVAVTAFWEVGAEVIIGAILAAVLIPAVYSYVIYRRLEAQPRESST